MDQIKKVARIFPKKRFWSILIRNSFCVVGWCQKQNSCILLLYHSGTNEKINSEITYQSFSQKKVLFYQFYCSSRLYLVFSNFSLLHYFTFLTTYKMLRMNSVQTIYEDKSYRANSQRLQPKKKHFKGHWLHYIYWKS